ncbi:aspartyl-phosphate phosphatase Spo0E family protein [Bacillus sp. CECT 9360]|uniref:aspartyl-phosphate phosphatase Spo0E family protein n=1 Tax=Bacillus sp. CECT 9360 TaxID=2845821 RepID=UPI001E3F2EDB|nr:aspartyl-phosphate phosphatase Spo0E family protein [Bacillus sp. CECT 9360]
MKKSHGKGQVVVTKGEFLAQIEKKRLELVQIVSKYGLSSSATLKTSQELDQLLNQYD